MSTKTKEHAETGRSEFATRLVSELMGLAELPRDDDPQPPSPIDPVIRFGIRDVLGPHPEPWRGAFSLDAGAGLAALNPQPLPPRWMLVSAIAQKALARAELIGEAAAAAGNPDGGAKYLSVFIDDWCGTPPRKFPWPGPGPRPKWAEATLGATEHLVFAGIIEATLATNPGGTFREGLENAHGRLVETAMAQLK